MHVPPAAVLHLVSPFVSVLLLRPPTSCSVLLGHREPPAAASVIEGDRVTSDEDEEDQEEEGEKEPFSSSFQSAVGRSAVSAGFDAKTNDPYTNPAVSSRSSTPVVPLMHRGRRASGSLTSPSPAPGGGGSRVRFDVYGEERHTRGSVPKKTQCRKHRDSTGGRERRDGREGAGKGPMISNLSGPSLLQVSEGRCGAD